VTIHLKSLLNSNVLRHNCTIKPMQRAPVRLIDCYVLIESGLEKSNILKRDNFTSRFKIIFLGGFVREIFCRKYKRVSSVNSNLSKIYET